MNDPDQRVGVVVITHNRRHELLRALARLQDLPERPHIVVVDNASRDGTASAVKKEFPAVELIASPENLGQLAATSG